MCLKKLNGTSQHGIFSTISLHKYYVASPEQIYEDKNQWCVCVYIYVYGLQPLFLSFFLIFSSFIVYF